MNVIYVLTLLYLPFNNFAEEEGVVWELPLPDSVESVSKWLDSNSYKISNKNLKNWTIDSQSLSMESIDASYEIKIKLPKPIDPQESRYLNFVYKVKQTPQGADLRNGKLEDSAFRIYVAFDKKARYKLFWKIPNAIIYAHGTANNVGQEFLSDRFKNVYFSVVGEGTEDSWIHVKRDLFADYQRFFKKQEVPAIIGLMIKIDSNNSSQISKASLKSIKITDK